MHVVNKMWSKSIMFTAFVSVLCNLGIKDLKEVRRELRAFSKKNWKKLGEELGLDELVLETIAVDHKGDGVEECLSEMLKHWLRGNYDDAGSNPPTWSNLADAVKETGESCTSFSVSFSPAMQFSAIHV